MVEFVDSEYTVSEGDREVQVCLRIDGQVADQAIVRLTAFSDTADGMVTIHKKSGWYLNYNLQTFIGQS